MKYLDEFRDGELAQKLARDIRQTATRTWSMMEVCGGQTHSIVRNGIDQLLEGAVEMIHGLQRRPSAARGSFLCRLANRSRGSADGRCCYSHGLGKWP